LPQRQAPQFSALFASPAAREPAGGLKGCQATQAQGNPTDTTPIDRASQSAVEKQNRRQKQWRRPRRPETPL